MQNQLIEEVLNSVENISTASPKPFLYTRVNATLTNATNTNEPKSVFSWLTQPVVALAIIAIVLIVNLIVLQQTNNEISEIDTDDTIVSNQLTMSAANLWNDNMLNK